MSIIVDYINISLENVMKKLNKQIIKLLNEFDDCSCFELGSTGRDRDVDRPRDLDKASRERDRDVDRPRDKDKEVA